MRKLTLALSTAAFALSGAAIAQTAPAPAAPAKVRAPMADMTRAQVQARAEARFARIDANQDGTLDQADRQARRGQRFDRIDTDRNGSISRAEFDAQTAKRAARAERRGHKRMAGKRMGARHAMMHAAGPMTRQAFVDRALTRFDRADANRDGTVTTEERKALRQSMRAQRQQG